MIDRPSRQLHQDVHREYRGDGLKLAVQTGLGSWAGAWDALVDQMPVPSPFLRSWWLEATAERPCFVLVFEDDFLAGGLALEEEWRGRLPVYRMMGVGLCPDHLDLVAAPEQAVAVGDAVAGWLSRPGSRVLDLEGVVPDSRLLAALPGRVRRDVVDMAPWEPLPRDPNVYFAHRSANFRANLRKAARRLTNEGAYHRAASPSSFDSALEALRGLHAARWGNATPFLLAFDRFAVAARSGAARGQVVLHEFVVEETVLASVVGFDVAGRLSLYQSGHATDPRWRNATTVLLHEIIAEACRLGRREVDLLRGTEPYKRSFASNQRPVVRLRAASGTAGRLVLTVSLARERTRRVAGRIVRRCIHRWSRRSG
ncbi:MAG TPA: GNAT family N-acetyltransferase [Acidimicrobiia bacterium]|nr:GNAT family N-acetyltransferase [Acidimicrobiia bacterium]